MSCVRESIQRRSDFYCTLHGTKSYTGTSLGEELQAALSELEKARESLRLSQSECAALRTTNEKLEADLKATLEELQFIREEKLLRKSAAGNTFSRLNYVMPTCIISEKFPALVNRKRVLLQQDNTRPQTARKTNEKFNQFDGVKSFDSSLIDCTKVDESRQSWISNKLSEKIACLEEEIEGLNALIESERRSHKAQLEDFIIAVKAAEREREEAQAELNRLLEVSRTISSADEMLWANLMQKYQCSTKWSALLAWAQAHLADYPTIFVTNFARDWNDGRAFCALVHHFQPKMVDRLILEEPKLCPVLAVQLAEKLKMHVDPKIFLNPTQDYRDVMVVVFELYKKLVTDEEQTRCSLDL
ncbi:hypothetical protein KIN20_011722 [Parelaphostrongylus tenuis]|uniref:Calponin-homology (CH) domain-containing protein n=1 Tax=Parelaphostrongylus tenuis TaxID=148309 RepID=A0AAD5QQ19_PARTN|nr:hypothetical protein KIN20_011722 [Parelaphostrongylus tenuis]